MFGGCSAPEVDPAASGGGALTVLVILGSLLVVAFWEFWRPRRRRNFPALRRRLCNLGFWVVNLVLTAFLLGSPTPARPRIEAMLGGGLPSWPIANAGLSLVAGFLLLDFLRYAVHRCEHAVPLFWRFHALHHSDPDVDVTTAVRHHPLEYLLTSAAYWIALIAFDLPVGAVLIHGSAVFAAAALQHGNIRLPETLERWLQPVLMTTDLHRIHHSVAPAEANANYGAVLSLWDRLFGTCVRMTRTQHNSIVFGVAELPRRDCLKPTAMLLTPWIIARPRGAGS
jgi:sterol desaturase/sphingolipid hydroxylase (fatty acid hydroxylase superfamily)